MHASICSKMDIYRSHCPAFTKTLTAFSKRHGGVQKFENLFYILVIYAIRHYEGITFHLLYKTAIYRARFCGDFSDPDAVAALGLLTEIRDTFFTQLFAVTRRINLYCGRLTDASESKMMEEFWQEAIFIMDLLQGEIDKLNWLKDSLEMLPGSKAIPEEGYQKYLLRTKLSQKDVLYKCLVFLIHVMFPSENKSKQARWREEFHAIILKEKAAGILYCMRLDYSPEGLWENLCCILDDYRQLFREVSNELLVRGTTEDEEIASLLNCIDV